MTEEAIREMPRLEKLKLMEALWKDLSHNPRQFESPAWHAEELAETKKRHQEGKEEVIDWEEAKKRLRDAFK